MPLCVWGLGLPSPQPPTPFPPSQHRSLSPTLSHHTQAQCLQHARHHDLQSHTVRRTAYRKQRWRSRGGCGKDGAIVVSSNRPHRGPAKAATASPSAAASAAASPAHLLSRPVNSPPAG